MFHETLPPLTLICFMLAAGPLPAADRLVERRASSGRRKSGNRCGDRSHRTSTVGGSLGRNAETRLAR
jgi:hypothetical protein